MEVPEDLGKVKTGVLKTPFTECWKSFLEDENEGCYVSSAWEVLFLFPRGRKCCKFTQNEGAIFLPHRGAIFLPHGQNEGCYFISARVLKRRFTECWKRLFRRRPFLCGLLSRPPSERQDLEHLHWKTKNLNVMA